MLCDLIEVITQRYSPIVAVTFENYFSDTANNYNCELCVVQTFFLHNYSHGTHHHAMYNKNRNFATLY